MNRYRRSCHEHHLELDEETCPVGCRKFHAHYRLECPAGHGCGYVADLRPGERRPSEPPWDCFDSAECWRHSDTPGLHTLCVYATANEDEILERAPWLQDFSELLLDQLDQSRQQYRTVGRPDNLPYAVGM